MSSHAIAPLTFEEQLERLYVYESHNSHPNIECQQNHFQAISEQKAIFLPWNKVSNSSIFMSR
jgi:hypothetical protein